MNAFTLKTIQYFIFILSCNIITAASAQNDQTDSFIKYTHDKGVDFAAFNAISTFKENYLSSPEDPKISYHKEAVRSIYGTGTLIVFASQGIHQAQAAIVYERIGLSVGKYSQPTPLQLLAGFAHLPGDICTAEKELNRLYDCKDIPNSKRKPFDGFDEEGKWKKFDLPEYLQEPALSLKPKKENKHRCSIQ